MGRGSRQWGKDYEKVTIPANKFGMYVIISHFKVLDHITAKFLPSCVAQRVRFDNKYHIVAKFQTFSMKYLAMSLACMHENVTNQLYHGSAHLRVMIYSLTA